MYTRNLRFHVTLRRLGNDCKQSFRSTPGDILVRYVIQDLGQHTNLTVDGGYHLFVLGRVGARVAPFEWCELMGLIAPYPWTDSSLLHRGRDDVLLLEVKG